VTGLSNVEQYLVLRFMESLPCNYWVFMSRSNKLCSVCPFRDSPPLLEAWAVWILFIPKGFRIGNAALRNPFRVEQIIAVTTQGRRVAATLGYLTKAVWAIQKTS
jgi:hypothetical protein